MVKGTVKLQNTRTIATPNHVQKISKYRASFTDYMSEIGNKQVDNA